MIYTKYIEPHDPRLGRHVVHDERSRGFALAGPIDKSTWHDKLIRLYDPLPNPNQTIGCCTGVSKCSQLNAVGNRVRGTVLDMDDAVRIYSRNTEIDAWPGAYPPDDTGSSGLASAKSAQDLGLGSDYWWEMRGADGVVQQIMSGNVVSVGTRWDYDMFQQDSRGRVHLGGGVAGGHQYVFRGYDKSHDELVGRCWWGTFRDFRIARADADTLLQDDGDAHIQRRAV